MNYTITNYDQKDFETKTYLVLRNYTLIISN